MTLGSLVLLSLNFSIFKWNPYLLCQLGFHITERKKQESRQMITEMERFIFLWRRSLVVSSLGYTATQGYLQENRLLLIFMLHLIFVFVWHPPLCLQDNCFVPKESVHFPGGRGGKEKDISFFCYVFAFLLAKKIFPLKLQWTDLGHVVTPSCKKKKKKKCQKMSFHVCFVTFVCLFLTESVAVLKTRSLTVKRRMGH